MTENRNTMLINLLTDVVNNQLLAKDPPETQTTLDRLIREGYPQEKAKKLIAAVVTTHIYNAMKNQQEFNTGKYIEDLNKLPQLPFEQ